MYHKVGLLPSKKLFYLLQWKPFKNDEKCFSFHLKNCFRSQDIYIFELIFLIRNIRLFSKFAASKPGYQTITILILPNISGSDGSQTMKFGQLIYHKGNIFLQKSCRKWGGETSSRHLFFKKGFMWGKLKWPELSFNIFRQASTWYTIKTNCIKVLNYWSRDMLNLDFSKIGLEIISSTFLYDFQEKCFSCYILLTDSISLSNCLYFLSFWAVFVFDVINFETNLILLIKSFSYMTKNSRQKI